MNALVSIVLIILSLAAPAKSHAEGGMGNGMRGARPLRMTQEKTAQSLKSGPGKLIGHCTLLAGGGNMIEGPCDNILVILNDANGTEVARARLEKNGDFSFEASDSGQYRLAAGSHLYEVVAPTGVLHGGQRVDLKLRQN